MPTPVINRDARFGTRNGVRLLGIEEAQFVCRDASGSVGREAVCAERDECAAKEIQVDASPRRREQA
jgi:hypothetical protein